MKNSGKYLIIINLNANTIKDNVVIYLLLLISIEINFSLVTYKPRDILNNKFIQYIWNNISINTGIYNKNELIW